MLPGCKTPTINQHQIAIYVKRVLICCIECRCCTLYSMDRSPFLLFQSGACCTQYSTLQSNIIMHRSKFDRLNGWKTSASALTKYVQMNVIISNKHNLIVFFFLGLCSLKHRTVFFFSLGLCSFKHTYPKTKYPLVRPRLRLRCIR